LSKIRIEFDQPVPTCALTWLPTGGKDLLFNTDSIIFKDLNNLIPYKEHYNKQKQTKNFF
jgi:hypothetical protein